METLLELYLKVSTHPRNCKITPEQRNEVSKYQKELSKFTKYPVRTSICNRYRSIEQGKKILTAHGKL